MHDITQQINIINRYRIQKQLSHKLGRSTYLAEDAYTDNLVIVKTLQFNDSFQWDDFKLFEREAKTIKNIVHPAIPKYLDYFDIDDANFKGFALVQTYIDAPSLEDIIQEGRKFTETELIELAQKILDILAYLHQQNPPVIHRDIKPSNILINNRSGNSIGDVYLVDFGSVQTVAHKDNGTITIVGSYGYIPLEQFSGETTVVSDLYSLGMTLIYLVTGVHPSELPKVDGKVQFNKNQIGTQFSQWLEKITYPYPDKRFVSATTAKAALTQKEASGNFLELKPKDTKIKLYRDRDKLEIVYQRDFNLNISKGCILFLIFWLFFPLILQIATNFLLLSIIITFLLSIIIMLLFFNYRNTFNPHNIVSIEKKRTIKMSNFYKSKTNVNWKNTSSFQSINLLAYNPGYIFDQYLDETGREIRRGRVIIEPQLSIYAGQVEYAIKGTQLSQAELWWLGKELSDFLDLELQVIYPTPKVPPESSCGGC